MTNPLLDFFDARKGEGRGIWKWRHYFEVYHRHLDPFSIMRSVVMLEIGVLGGGSLEMWREYLRPSSTIHGVDINPECARFSKGNMHVHTGDACDMDFWAAFRSQVPILNVVIDDGGHEAHQQIAAFNALFTHLQPGGVYIVEDMEPNAFMAEVHRMVWNLQPSEMVRSDDPARSIVSPANPLQALVAAVHVYPGMVVIERNAETVTEFVAERRGQW